MKQKLLLLLFFLFVLSETHAQAPLKFNTKFYNAIDSWVAFPAKPTDSVYNYGFIYLDVMAGPTFNLEGQFKVNGKQLQKIESAIPKTASYKFRLGPNTHLIHVLSEEQLAELKADKVPVWLANYKTGDDKYYQIALGNMYNANGKADLAKPILEKIYQTEKSNEKLIFELAYAYNALNEFDKAVSVLNSAIKNNPENALYYKELVYAYSKLKNLKKAEDIYADYLNKSKDKTYQYEMAYNILYLNFENKDKPNFDKWASVVEQSNKPQFIKNVEAMRQNWDKK